MSGHGLPTTRNKVQELQRTLYRAAKADPKRRFHALYDKVYRRDILERAWEQVSRNRGAAGIDGVTLAEVERYGVERLLDELATELKEGSYRVKPSRRVWIPKPGRSERRPLSIPSVRDRIVQASLKLVVEPVFEADFLPSSFGFRPKRTTHDALQVLIGEAWRGRRWVVGYRLEARVDTPRPIDGGRGGTDKRPSSLEAGAGVAARRGDGVGVCEAQRDRYAGRAG